MKSGKFTIREFFMDNSLEQVIVPEIQRDYVWAEPQVNGLLRSILEDYKSYLERKATMTAKNPDVVLYEKHMLRIKCSCNIGFIYAYYDKDYDGKYFLIDGQQRITTIFLLLLVLSSRNEEFRKIFEKIYMVGKFPRIDYKVRESAHFFLEELVNAYSQKIDITNQNWYYTNEYQYDKTIQSLISNIESIEEFLTENNLLTDKNFIDYVQNYIEFWYFDISVSEQGEELYIYMNARGEQTQKNENLKAEILGQINDIGKKNACGQEWEQWQEFFWKNRGSNPNADTGFDEFISCISGLSKYNIDNEKLSFDIIKQYYNALSRFYSLEKRFDSSEEHEFKWIRDCVANMKNLLNTDPTNWFAVYTDDNRTKERRRMVFMWFVLELFKSKSNDAPVTNLEIRALRFIWIRYNNNNRSVRIRNVNIISQLVDWWKMKEFDKIEWTGDEKLAGDEKEKYNYLNINNIAESDFTEEEKMIWKIEDHPLNLDGRDLGNINISHIVDFSTNPDLKTLQHIYDNFIKLFPTTDCNTKYEKHLKTLLLHYKDHKGNPFWERVSPWYYENYNCSDWRRIIRNTIFKEIFSLLFDANNQCKINDLLQEKKKEFYAQYENVNAIRNITSRRRQLIVYSDLIGDIWVYGNIVFYNTQNNETRVFLNEHEYEIYSLDRYFRGYHLLFWDKVKGKNINSELQQILDKYKI